MNKKTLSTSLKQEAKDLSKPEQKNNSITQLEHVLIVFILKKFSNKNNPLSARIITDYLCQLTGQAHSDKTILKKLLILCGIQTPPVHNTLCLTLGGNIIEVSNLGKEGITKKQSKFYFEPFLTTSDLSLICGAISSNRYLSACEKDYLIRRLMALTTSESQLDNALITLSDMSADPSDYNKNMNNEQASIYNNDTLLKHINHLYDAIKEGYMIEIIYGIYETDTKTYKPVLNARNSHKPYKLNPYAMLWNGGAFYLLATHGSHENPVHFRVDRILTIKDIVTADDARVKEPRHELPATLEPFFETTSRGMEFCADKYASTYPLMGIYDVKNLTNCYIECTTLTLSLLVDAFGTNIKLFPSHVPHEEKELDFHGNPQTFLIAGIQNIQYDNMVLFCSQHHSSITAIYPPALVNDVQRKLQESADKYKNLPTNVQRTPF